MVAQSFTLGGTTSSPFSTLNNADYVSEYRPQAQYVSPLSGAFLANGTPGYATGAGVVGTSEVVRSDGLYYRPLLWTSVSMTFTAASSTVQLQIATANTGGGGSNGPNQGDASTVTWNSANATEPFQDIGFSCTTTGANEDYFVGFEKQDANTTTWRRGASSNTTIAPNGIYENGTRVNAWDTTALRATVSWWHVPNHPTSLTATGGTNPGEVNLSWTAPSDNGGDAVYGYRIAYKKTGTSTWYVYGTSTYQSPSNTTSTSETLRGLDPGSEYSFVVAALNIVTDRHNGPLAYPDRIYADYSATTAHTGQNSNIATGTATALSDVTPKFGAYSEALAKFVAASPKVRGTSAWFDGTPWIYDGSKWNRPLQITGGNTATYTSAGITYTVHTFSSSGNFYVKECQAGLAISYLVVGGGGGGGGRYMGGGGGAGGVLSGTATLTSNTNYGVVVGTGGAGGSAEGIKGVTGKDSSFNGVIAKGGGGAGAWTFSTGGDAKGLAGGSGGGNSGYSVETAPAASLGTSGQGNNGGLGGQYGAGGGGGAGAVGSTGTSTVGGAGGVGVSNSITGSAVFYGGGGGGASYTSTTVPQGGNGGGGNGAPGPATAAGGLPTAGTNGTGGGGGGAQGYGTTGATAVGGAGGNGVVIISYISSIT
jgi:hypothetical protein